MKKKFRIKQGGKRINKYTEGWIEFADKKVAKMVALSFNNKKIGKYSI
jgi:ESF2/ABP1 family protein